MMYDFVAHASTSISYRHCARKSLLGAMDPVALRLKEVRNRTVPKISSRDVAEALDVPASTYAAYEDPKKNKKPIIALDLAKKLIPIFEARGIPPEDVLQLAGITGELTEATRRVEDARSAERAVADNEWVEVSGAVAAGVWREQTDWPSSERYEVKFGAPPYSGAKRFAVRMEGLSMNKTIPPGSDLECLWVKFSKIGPQAGSLVIVERVAHDLTEMTCKRLDKDDRGWLLRAESTEPEFAEPIRFDEPDPDLVTDGDIRIIGLVLSAQLDLAPIGMSQRRYSMRS